MQCRPIIFPLSSCKNLPPYFFMVDLLHRLYGVGAPVGHRGLCSWTHTAAERRPCSNRLISAARRAHSNKPAAAGLLQLWGKQTDRERRTDTVNRSAMWAVPKKINNCREGLLIDGRSHRRIHPMGHMARVPSNLGDRGGQVY